MSACCAAAAAAAVIVFVATVVAVVAACLLCRCLCQRQRAMPTATGANKNAVAAPQSAVGAYRITKLSFAGVEGGSSGRGSCTLNLSSE